MAGWIVTVAVVRDNDELGHETYAVAIDDPGQAAQSALSAANSDAAVVDGEIDEASMRRIGLKAGDLLKILDETSDPLTTGKKRH